MNATSDEETLRSGPLDVSSVEADVLLGELRAQMFGRSEPTTLGRFELRRLVGRGSHGSVYLAEDPQLHRPVAVKLLGAQDSETNRARLLREAQVLAGLNHPNVLTIHDVGLERGRVFVAMEYVEAGTLARWCEMHPPGTRARFFAVLDLAIAVARGLAAAHAAGIVHRDVKPANILVGGDGRPRIADFGLARPAIRERDEGMRSLDPSDGASDATIARTGDVVGTPAYMPPEQFEGHADAASDQWSFCAAFWEAAYGRRPFAGDNVAALIAALQGPPVPPAAERSEVPRWWRAILGRGLSRDPAERWPSIATLATELERKRERPRRVAIFAAGLVVIGSTIGFAAAAALQRSNACDASASAIADVWNDDARTDLENAFRGTEVPYAEDVLRSVLDRLDAYRVSWATEYVDACEATHVRAEQSPELLDRRMGCLDERRRELAAVVDVLRDADAGVVLRGVETVGGLRSLRPCSDLVALNSRLTPPPDTAIDLVADIRAEVQAALALERAGRAEAAAARWSAAHASAEEVGWRPLLVELEVARLGVTKLGTDPASESKRVRSWLDVALAVGDDASASRLAADLGWLAGYERSDPEDGRAWYATARALGERFEPDWLLELTLLNGEAVFRTKAHDFDGAVPLFEQALALAEEHDPGGLRPATLRFNIAGLWAEHGDFARAVVLASEAVLGYEANLGPLHPLVGDVYGNLGAIHLKNGDEARAEEYLGRALQIFEPVLPAGHPRIVNVEGSLATLAGARGERERGIALWRRVIAAREAANRDGELVWSYANLASALLTDDHAEADVLAEVDELAERALAIARRIGPVDSEVTPLLLRADVALRRGDAGAAVAWLARAAAASTRTSAPLATRLEVRMMAVRVALARRDTAATKVAIDEAETTLREVNPPFKAREHFVLAKARWEVAYDRARAIELAESAEAALVDTSSATRELSKVRDWLAAHR